MLSTFIAASMLSLVSSTALASAPPQLYPPAWGKPMERQVRPAIVTQTVPSAKERRSFHHSRGHNNGRTISLPSTPPSVTRLQLDVAALRKELEAFRAQLHPATLEKPVLAPSFVQLGLWGAVRPPEKVSSTFNLPTLGVVAPLPEPLPLPFLSRLESEAVDRVRLARVYLAQTATVGLTMARQGVEVALGRLHPDFAVKLAEAIKRAREAGLAHAGVFSAYRPPAFGIGGFSDKFNSLHSYGLAADVAGIGEAGSRQAMTWQKIVNAVGLFLPYGSRDRSEFNHTQLLPTKIANAQLRKTITASSPKDLPAMWMASGNTNFIKEEIHAIASATKLPVVDWSQ